MKIKLVLLLALISNIIGFSQIKGNCIDENGKGISYVNVTVKGQTFGTVSNEKGAFILTTKTLNKKDSLIFSHINFETKIIGFSNNPETIKMYSKTQKLDEVIVSNRRNRKVKEKIIGTKTESGNVILEFVSKNLGTEVGKIIKVKKNKVYDIKKVFFNVVDLGYKSVNFRINFYPIKNGVVEATKINYIENIVKVEKTGLVEIDISNQNLSFDNDFLTSIEWISFENEDTIDDEQKIIHISSTVFSGPFANRYNVNLPWRMYKAKFNIGLGIHLIVDSY